LQAQDPREAIRLRANRLFVVRRGRVIARTPRQQTTVYQGEAMAKVDFATDG